MAWTTPRTWVTAEVVSASNMNTHVRDNFNVTAPAVATAASGLIVTTAANTVIQRTPVAVVSTGSVTTTSTSYVNLTPTVGSLATTGTKAIVHWSAGISNSSAGALTYVGIDISGDTTLSASDDIAVVYESGAANDFAQMGNTQLFSGLTAGSNSFQQRFRVTAGTGTFINRRMTIIPL